MNVIALVGLTLEMLILYYYFNTNLEKRYSAIKTFLLFCAIDGLNVIKCILIFDMVVVKSVTTMIIQLLIVAILYKDKWYKKIFVYMVYLFIIIMSEVISMMVAKIVYNNELINAMELSLENILWSLTMYLVSFILCILSALLIKRKEIELENRITQYVFLYLGVQFFIAVVFVMFFCEYNNRSMSNIIMAFSIVMIAFAVAMLLFNAVKTMSKKSAEAEFIKKESEIKDRHFFEIKAQYMEYRKLRHDFYNHIKVLDTMDDKEKIKEYINEVKERFDKMERISYCNNPSLDALLSIKAKEAEAEGIKTLFEVCDMTKVNVSDFDICSVVANLLDNAIEAAKKTLEKYIDLEINLKADRVIVVVKNSSNEPERNLATTKKDKENHGIGLQSVRETAAKYDGDCVFKFNKNEFVSIVNMKA